MSLDPASEGVRWQRYSEGAFGRVARTRYFEGAIFRDAVSMRRAGCECVAEMILAHRWLETLQGCVGTLRGHGHAGGLVVEGKGLGWVGDRVFSRGRIV